MRILTTRLIPLILITLMMMGGAPSTTPVKAWGLVTHTFIATEALSNVDAAWLDIFDFYSIEILQGALYPDVVLQNWDSHLYYPDDPTNKTGPQDIKLTLDIAIGLFEAGKWADGFFKLGIASHYMADMNIPIHTGELYGGDTPESNPIHAKVEGDINSEINSGGFTLNPRATIVLNSTYDAEDFAIDQATAANAYRDDVMMNYPDETSNALTTNTTYYSIIEGQVEEAIFSVGTLYNAGVAGLTVPTLPSPSISGKVVIDKTHGNDYSGSALTQVADDLGRSFEILFDSSAISSSTDVKTLIITAPTIGFTNFELNLITAWLSSGERNIILTSRGDFSSAILLSNMNTLLGAIDSQIRVNDDSVYTTNPEAYFPSSAGSYTWYVETKNIVDPNDTAGITSDITNIQFYSPGSLYFTSTDENLMVLAYGDPYSFQTDQNGGAIAKIWDDTQDSTGGDAIPLAAVETIGDDKIAVFGSTIFSDFDYGRVESVILLHNVLEWFDVPVPVTTTSTTSSTTSTTSTTTTTTPTTTSGTSTTSEKDSEEAGIPISIFPIFLGITFMAILTYSKRIIV